MRCGAGRVDRSAMGRRGARRPNGSALGGGRRRRRSGGPVRAHGFVPSTVSAVRAAPCRRRCPRSSAIRAHHDAGKREGAHGHARAVKRWPSSRGHGRLRRARAGFGPRAGLRAGPKKRAAPAPCASVGALGCIGCDRADPSRPWRPEIAGVRADPRVPADPTHPPATQDPRAHARRHEDVTFGEGSRTGAPSRPARRHDRRPPAAPHVEPSWAEGSTGPSAAAQRRRGPDRASGSDHDGRVRTLGRWAGLLDRDREQACRSFPISAETVVGRPDDRRARSLAA